jgi:hypothetical protein
MEIEQFFTALGVMCFPFLLLAWPITTLWCAIDASDRQRPWWAVLILVGVFWPWAWLGWLVLRPDVPSLEVEEPPVGRDSFE